VRLVEKVGIGAVCAPADPAPQLVELGQAKGIGIVDDHGVDIRDVDAGLDDGRGQQDIEVVPDKAHHDLLEHALVHLAVTDPEPRFRHDLSQPVRETINIVNPVMNDIHLPATVHLPQDDLAYQLVAELRDEGPDRQPGLWSCLYHGDVADTRQREMERARNRCRGH